MYSKVIRERINRSRWREKMAGENLEIQLAQDVMMWYGGAGLSFLQRLNLREGHVILDFGCRVGNYTIPAAEIVGETGRIYALDVDHSAVNEMIARAGKFGLENIVPMKTEGELELDLPNKSIDVILFFDVIYPICKNKGITPYRTLLKEFKRIMRKGGILITLFNHLKELNVTVEEVIEITAIKLRYVEELKTELLHWDSLKEGIVHIFVKK